MELVESPELVKPLPTFRALLELLELLELVKLVKPVKPPPTIRARRETV